MTNPKLVVQELPMPHLPPGDGYEHTHRGQCADWCNARLRAKGWRASEAWRAAKVRDQFDELEAEGLVRLRAVPDEDLTMTIEEALKRFTEKTGCTRVRREGFGPVFTHMTDRKPYGEGFAEEDALALLCEWYAAAEPLRKHGPLYVVETYRQDRVWVTFLAWKETR